AALRLCGRRCVSALCEGGGGVSGGTSQCAGKIIVSTRYGSLALRKRGGRGGRRAATGGDSSLRAPRTPCFHSSKTESLLGDWFPDGATATARSCAATKAGFDDRAIKGSVAGRIEQSDTREGLSLPAQINPLIFPGRRIGFIHVPSSVKVKR